MTAEIATSCDHTATWDTVGMLLDELAARHDASLLLEDVAGRITAHSLVGQVSGTVVDAVLTRTSTALHQRRIGNRVVTGLDAPVVTTQLPDWDGPVAIL